METTSPGQRSATAAATLAAGTLIAQQVAGKATRDTLFLSTFPVSSLPAAMIASALVSAVAVLGFSAALSRRSPARVVPPILATATALLLAEWGLSLSRPSLAAALVYLHMAAFGATVVSGFWSVINERFDPYAARRVMGTLGLGASVGGVAGGLLAWSASGLIPPPAMLAVMAALNVACLLALARLQATAPDAEKRGPRAARTEGTSPLLGVRFLGEVPYLRDLALVVALGAATETLLDYVLNARAVAAFPRGQPLMSFFALFHTGVGLLALAVQMTLSRPALQGLGLAGTVALRPLAVAVAALLGLLDPRLWSALVARGAHGVLHNSLFRSGYELLFTPLAERKKRPTKAIVDVGFDKLGAVAGGLLVLACTPLGGQAARVLFALAMAGALGAVVVSRRLSRGYVTALEESLRSGVVRLELGDVHDSTTYMTLARTGVAFDREAMLREVAALRGEAAAAAPGVASDAVPHTVADLRSGDPEAVRRALRQAETVDAALVGHLVPLLASNELFLDVLRPLRRAAPRVTGQLLDALLDPSQDLAVRRRIPRVLRASRSQRAVDGLVQALGDSHFEVRRQSALALARITEREPSLLVPRPVVFTAAVRELGPGLEDWTEDAEPSASDDRSPEATPQTPAERRLAHVFTLLSLAVEREPLQTAYWALFGPDQALRGTALEYLENVLPDDVRQALWAHLGARPAASKAARPRQEVVSDLMRSSDTLRLRREMPRRTSTRQ